MPRTRSGSDRTSPPPVLPSGAIQKPKKNQKKKAKNAKNGAFVSFPHHKLSQYVHELQSLPTTKSGLLLQCQMVNDRLKKIENEHGLVENSTEETLSALLQKVQQIDNFGPHGKVGMHVRKETLEKLEEALSIVTEVEETSILGEEPSSVLREESLIDFVEKVSSEKEILEETESDNVDLDKESIHDTFEGLDRDLLGVNSQAALDKISAFVTRTISENHPAKNLSSVCKQASTSHAVASVPIIRSSISSSSLTKERPFKFAFLSVVATYDAKCSVSLEDLHAKVRTITFDPTFFHSAVLTFPKSESRAAIFENGKFVITGVTTIKMALIATRNVLEILKFCGYQPDINKKNFRAKNLTALMELGVNIDIGGFAEKYQNNTYMDQDTFGAVTHFPEKSPSTIHKGGLGLCMLIFATGKIVLVGGKTEKHMISVFREKTLNILKPFAFGYL